jgi:cell pole-organizing protein PopZ
MEEILASIRRIISDDEAGKPVSSKPAPATIAAPARAEAKSRQNDCDAVPAGFDAAGDRPDDPADTQVADTRVTADVIALAEAMQAKVSAVNGMDHAPQELPDRPLLSPRTTAAVDTAFNSLTHTMLMQNPRTLEDLVREMLKPMLKAWLDDNLPNIVERLVRAEIERVSRGRP